MTDDVEETNSGVKKKGNWKEVAEFGEEVEEAMKETVDEESVEEFEEWRPKEEEAENDMKKKTIDKALLRKNRLEQESNGVAVDIRDAGEKIAEVSKKATEDESLEEEITEVSEDVARPFYSKMAQFFRKFESLVYKHVILRGKRYYLDTEDFSVDVKSRRDGNYEMDVNIPEEGSRETVKQKLEEEETEGL